jgi:RND family efflux transporter MFP subunit
MYRKILVINIISACLLFFGCKPGQHDSATHQHDETQAHSHGEHSHDGEHSHESDEIHFSEQQAAAAGLQTETVVPAPFCQVIKVGGQIESAQGDEHTVVATVAGTVAFAKPSTVEGMTVNRGETLFVVSTENMQDNPVAIARLNYETAQKEYLRNEQLINDKLVSMQDYEQSRLRYETARTVYEAQAKNVTPTGVRVTSPIGGYLKSRLARQGEYVSVGQPVAVVSQNRRLQLRAEVPEKYFNTLNTIQSANFRTAYSDSLCRLASLNGKLLSFGRSAGNSTFYIPVIFDFDNVGSLIPGSFAEVYLLAAPRSNVISIPVSALTEEQGLYFVYLQIDDDGYKKQEVTRGASDGERIEILAGLKQNDRVVVKGVYHVKIAANTGAIPEGHTHAH